MVVVKPGELLELPLGQSAAKPFTGKVQRLSKGIPNQNEPSRVGN